MIGPAPIVSGEMHYPRIPRAYWRARMRMAHAMGVDAISTYAFWNVHEPRRGSYDFNGENDIAEYVRLAGATGLDVILRPGPYVCAEWDFGGLPAWLLTIPGLRIRTADKTYMEPVRTWLRRLGEELAPLQRAHGGPVVAIQLENEYGAFGADAEYLRLLRAALDDAGFGVSPYYTIDQPRDLARGSLAEVPMAATFAPGDPERDLAELHKIRAKAPPICGEYWAGWFDRWGEPHQQRDEGQQTRDLEWMLEHRCSINLYMLCGGTNFGFFNGANGSAREAYAPVTTSYDYLAAIDEAGRPTAKYFAFRDAIARHRAVPPRVVPPPAETIAFPPCALDESAALDDVMAQPIASERPMPMERCEQPFGYILYRTILPRAGSGRLEIEELHDYATILLDRKLLGYLDRRKGENSLRMDVSESEGTLEILVENCGRINYGPLIGGECKGITRAVRWNGEELLGWDVFPLPLDDLSRLRFSSGPRPAPAFHRGIVHLREARDTFVDTSALGKGVLFVNGRNAGRYWRIGPQRSLYVPGTWLRAGANEIITFDITPLDAPTVRGGEDPERPTTTGVYCPRPGADNYG
jgi:beta-galactosidase